MQEYCGGSLLGVVRSDCVVSPPCLNETWDVPASVASGPHGMGGERLCSPVGRQGLPTDAYASQSHPPGRDGLAQARFQFPQVGSSKREFSRAGGVHVQSSERPELRLTLPTKAEFAEGAQIQAQAVNQAVFLRGTTARLTHAVPRPSMRNLNASKHGFVPVLEGGGIDKLCALAALPSLRVPNASGRQVKGAMLCKFFGMERGCKKGLKCQFLHAWKNLPTRVRAMKCWKCGSVHHVKREVLQVGLNLCRMHLPCRKVGPPHQSLIPKMLEPPFMKQRRPQP